MRTRIIESRVAPADGGKRLIDYLCGRFSYLDQGQWLSCIAEGSLVINGAGALPQQTLRGGELLSFTPPTLEEPPVPLHYAIDYEDDDYLIVNKPPLLPVHPGGIFFQHTLWRLLKQKHANVHIMTRLDRETSGLVLIAKHKEAARHVHDAQQTHALDKRYLAVAHGVVSPEYIEAQGWLAPDESSLVRKKRRYCAVEPESAQAESCSTLFYVHGSWEALDGPRSLVEARLITGRGHQIRATLLALGYPILGDKLYGLDEGFFLRFIDGSLSESDRERLVLPYQALHCSLLSFIAADGKPIRAEAPPPWPQSLGIEPIPGLGRG